VKVFDFDGAPSRAIEEHGSERVNVTPMSTPQGDAHVVCIRFGPGGLLGRHPATVDQLFVVVQGEGWTSGADGERVDAPAGTAVYWAAGEEHESGSEEGMTAIVVQAERIVPHV
jgi:quercetin dioxygenase-like cupin family protein